MSYVNIITVVLSHIVASLYVQKQKYNKLVTACFWGAYAIFCAYIMMFQENVIIGFFSMLFMQAVIFYVTSVGSLGENTFLFLTYSNLFCICIGANLVLSAIFYDSLYLQVYQTVIVILMHIFLYKILIPNYKKSRIFFSSGWWKLNIVLVFFLIQFLNQYAFNIVDSISAVELAFDFVIFSIIFCSTLILIFNLVKSVAETNKRIFENDELKNVAYTDALTHMQNRAAYAKFTRRQSLNHRKNNSTFFTFVILDIDGFKNINDTKGHAAGDEILKQVGATIAKNIESVNCKSYRIGGDEFVLLLENMQLSDAEELVRKINEDLYNLNSITVSYGCSNVDFNNAKPFEEALKKADAIMYSHKQQHRLH